MVDPEAAEILSTFTIPAEQLVWAGRPKQGPLFRITDVIMIPWMCGCTALFWFAVVRHVISDRFPSPVLWIVCLFGIAMLYGVIGRFGMDAWQRARTYYGVTDSRILIVSGLFSHRLSSFPLQAQQELELTENSGGYGTIIIGSSIWDFMYMGNVMPDSQRFSPRFDHIPEAKRVYELIRVQQGRTLEK